jgi:hypothetical protein
MAGAYAAQVLPLAQAQLQQQQQQQQQQWMPLLRMVW